MLTFEETGDGFATRYDPALMKSLEAYDLDQPLPTMWPQFEGLARMPTLALRGENSDLLAPETVEEMARRHPRFEAHTVAGQGHAPLILDEPTIQRVCAFIAQAAA
jgi:pimeloyl-ACP methyl ester carboxylesterase